MTELVKMIKDGKTADVHPNEVENYKQGDWVEAPKPKAKKARAK